MKRSHAKIAVVVVVMVVVAVATKKTSFSNLKAEQLRVRRLFYASFLRLLSHSSSLKARVFLPFPDYRQ